MNIDVFNEALELRNKQVLCEELMEYLSDPDTAKGLKYKTLLAKFAVMFKSDFMMFVHTMGVKAGEAFEDLHDCCPDCNCNGDVDEPQTPPEDAKFQLGDRVEVVKGIHTGSLGTVVDYDSEGLWRVKLDKYAHDPIALAIWFDPESLEPYMESEEGENKEPKFPIGSKVKVVAGDYKGEIGEVKEFGPINSSYYVSSNKFSMWFAGSELEAYVEESEDSKDPTPEQKVFAIGDKVYVNIDESALDEDDKDWYVGVIVGYEESTNIYVVDVIESDDVTYTFNVHPDQLELYTEPEKPEENGGTTETDKGE